MAQDPRYVRLAEHLTDVTIADVAGGSGWSIAGNAVVPFPEDEVAARYVRQQLARGLLESAGKAEFNEQEASNKAMATAAGTGNNLQENRIQAAARSQRAARSARTSEEEGSSGEDT